MDQYMLPKFSPLASVEDGMQAATLSGPQLLTTLFAVPALACSAWVQADADITFRLDGDVGGGGMSLPAKVILPLSNITELQQLVLTGSATVTVQFGVGDVGPIPPAPLIRPSSGGGGGSGTVTSINVAGGDTGLGTTGGPITASGTITLTGRARVDTDNAVHVMMGGNDATGMRGRLDRPFGTVGAAATSSVPGDTIIVWPGTYIAANLNISHRSIHLINATLTTPFEQNTFIVTATGQASITSDGTSKIDHAGGNIIISAIAPNVRLHVQVPELSNSDDGIAACYDVGGHIYIQAEYISAGGNNPAFQGWETAEVYGTLTCGWGAYYITNAESVTHHGVITAVEVGVQVEGGRFVLYGDIAASSSAPGACIISNSPSLIEVYGNVTATGANCAGIRGGAGSVSIYGDVTAKAVGAVYADMPGYDGNVIVYGNVSCTQRHAVYTNRPNVTVYGHCTSAGTISDANGVLVDGPADVHVYGNCLSKAGAAAKVNDGKLYVHGNAHSVSRWGAFVMLTGELTIDGIASSGALEGAWLEGQSGNAKMTIRGGAKASTGNMAAVSYTAHPGNVLIIGGGAYLEPHGTGWSITRTPLVGTIDVRCLGAHGTGPVNPSVTYTGTFNIVP